MKKLIIFLIIASLISGCLQEENIFGTSAKGCEKQFEKFGASPLRIEDIDRIEPMGRMGQDHVLPVDHQYFLPPEWEKEPRPRDVLALGDGYIISVERSNYQAFAEYSPITDHRVVIEYSCNVFTIYIHVTELSEKVSATLGEMEPGSRKSVRIPVEEGEVIGKIKLLPELEEAKLYQLDFSVVDTDVTLPGFTSPRLYEGGEPWKLHIVDPFDYFKEPVRSQLLEKNLRNVEPYGGKIDYDIDGKLVGNWFVGGVYRQEELGDRYWQNHLAIAYDYIDPTLIRINIGDFNGKPGDFAVKGNSPDPGEIGVGTQVKYELVGYEYVDKGTGEYLDRLNFNKNMMVKGWDELSSGWDEDVRGVILFELIENRKLKVETFPGKTGQEVSGFTGNARIYER